jgi:hypothetical protein
MGPGWIVRKLDRKAKIISVITLLLITLTTAGIFVSNSNKDLLNSKCANLGEISTKNGSTYECRRTASGFNAYFDNTKREIQEFKSPEPIKTCQIRDARKKIVQNDSIAYPIKNIDPKFNSKSKVKIALIPIDFSDFPGNESPVNLIEEIKSISDEWARWYTNGRLKFEWVDSQEWLRAPKDSKNYNWVHPYSGAQRESIDSGKVGQELISFTDSQLNISGVGAFLFIYPKGITSIQDSINYRAGQIQTKRGLISAGVYAASENLYRTYSGENLAMWLLHEHMHAFRFTGHSPAWPPLFSISHATGPSKTMHAWDRIVLDWVTEKDLYCNSISNILNEEITLVPQEREQLGFKAMAIKVDETKMLVIESHRRDKWSIDFNPGFYGVTIMLVDTTRDTDRSGEGSGDDYRGTRYSRTATYFQFDKYENEKEVMGNTRFESNFLLKESQFFEYKNLKITFLKSDYNDKIEVKKLVS